MVPEERRVDATRPGEPRQDAQGELTVPGRGLRPAARQGLHRPADVQRGDRVPR
jgi:hypothetical protein